MCMTTCHDCGAYIDTDADPHCYLGEWMKEFAVCESCREVRAMDDAATELFSELWAGALS